jgi:hypothetical protein
MKIAYKERIHFWMLKNLMMIEVPIGALRGSSIYDTFGERDGDEGGTELPT